MRHRKAGYKLGRNTAHRLALYRNLAAALFVHERIVTTLAKAKAVRPFVERLITLAKRGDLHARRLVMARLGPCRNILVSEEDEKDRKKGKSVPLRTVVQKLFDELGPRFKDRPGGYTRIIKRPQRRLGDAGPTVFLELLREGETKVRARPPAPRVEEPPKEETPAEESASQKPEASSS
jgi:large subunit ribosomal protein L17